MTGFRVCFAALVAIALAGPTVSSVFAQQTESRIVGRLLDESKAALPGVTVTVTSKQTGAVRTAVTDADGSYVVTNLGARRATRCRSSCPASQPRPATSCSASASSRPSTSRSASAG